MMKKLVLLLSVIFTIQLFTLPAQTEPPLPKELQEELARAENEGGSRFYEEFSNMIMTLGVVIVFIILFLWILKKMLSGKIDQINQKSTIKILEQRTLNPRTSIYILNIFGKIIAVADSSNGVTRLTEFTKEEIAQKKE